jgi:LL-diaminopimelate aminotransferase
LTLGVGDPDLPTPEHIIGEMKRAVDDATNHQYPSYSGMSDFKEAVAWWYEERFNVALDPASEVVSLIGSKEGLPIFPWPLSIRGMCPWCPAPLTLFTTLRPCLPAANPI